MKSEYLQTLVASVDLGSFSKAADNLCVTQSAVSRRIKFLEEQYGFPLIDRSGPFLEPTDAGKIVIEKAIKMLSLEKELLHDLQLITPTTSIMFCCTPAFGVVYLTNILKDFMFSNPDTTELRFFFDMPNNVIGGLHEGLYQVGVIEHNEDFDLSEFETYHLPGDEVVFVSSPQLGLQEENVSIDQLTPYDLYTRKEGCCSSKLLEINMRSMGRDCNEFKRVIFSDDLHLIIESVRKHAGIAFVPRPVVEGLVKQGHLHQHRVAEFKHAFKRTLIVNSTASSTSSDRLNSLVSCILSELSCNTSERTLPKPAYLCS